MIITEEFQSTLPHGERLSRHGTVVGVVAFQSTLPHGERRNSTRVLGAIPDGFQSTLPHGERLRFNPLNGEGVKFQSTLPHGERQPTVTPSLCMSGFNPRSRTGSDAMDSARADMERVSIHAPARGATVMGRDNPPRLVVSIHAPARGATLAEVQRQQGEIVSIHAPARGATFR
ncbi:hypothetical protein SAMN05444162_2904 [Paenibacillaceae bacterium GAS479]|nr:hypothetical protein SAMN05444162_2904 [Paenibacillaceae bacterium GAS479]